MTSPSSSTDEIDGIVFTKVSAVGGMKEELREGPLPPPEVIERKFLDLAVPLPPPCTSSLSVRPGDPLLG